MADRDLKNLEKDLKRALDKTLAETVISIQSELGSEAISPKDTGRFRSSWFAAEGTASNAVAPEGTDQANEDAKGLKIDSRREYHITNSLEYAQHVAIGERVVSQPKTWFADFRNSRIPKIVDKAVKVVKAEEGL